MPARAVRSVEPLTDWRIWSSACNGVMFTCVAERPLDPPSPGNSTCSSPSPKPDPITLRTTDGLSAYKKPAVAPSASGHLLNPYSDLLESIKSASDYVPYSTPISYPKEKHKIIDAPMLPTVYCPGCPGLFLSVTQSPGEKGIWSCDWSMFMGLFPQVSRSLISFYFRLIHPAPVPFAFNSILENKALAKRNKITGPPITRQHNQNRNITSNISNTYLVSYGRPAGPWTSRRPGSQVPRFPFEWRLSR